MRVEIPSLGRHRLARLLVNSLNDWPPKVYWSVILYILPQKEFWSVTFNFWLKNVFQSVTSNLWPQNDFWSVPRMFGHSWQVRYLKPLAIKRFRVRYLKPLATELLRKQKRLKRMPMFLSSIFFYFSTTASAA